MIVRRIGITSRRWRGAQRLGRLLALGLVVLLVCRMPAQALARDSQHSIHLSPAQARLSFTASRETSAASARLRSDAPSKAVDVRAAPGQADQGRRVSAGAVIGLALAFLASAIALGIAFGIRRRIDRLVPPPDDEED